MHDLHFEWNQAKARENLRKHGVSFDEAKSAFADERGILLEDRLHLADEDRFVLIGLSATLRILVVVHCYPADDSVIRLLSARRATLTERAQYDAQDR